MLRKFLNSRGFQPLVDHLPATFAALLKVQPRADDGTLRAEFSWLHYVYELRNKEEHATPITSTVAIDGAVVHPVEVAEAVIHKLPALLQSVLLAIQRDLGSAVATAAASSGGAVSVILDAFHLLNLAMPRTASPHIIN